jgi:DNA polymerase elongation subunit (family B)
VTNLENQMNKTPNKKKLGSLAGWLKKATTSGTAGGDNSKSLYKQQKYAAENRKHVGAKRKRQTKVVDATYSGAFVFEPIKGVHIERIDGGKGTRPRWIVVLDFKSLYPMLMVSRNMSHDTLITTRKMARYGIALADCVRVVIGPPEFPAGELECELIEKYDPQTGETTWSECNAKVAYFVQPHVRDNKEGIMCKLENKMLSERKVAKKKKAKCEDPTTGKSLKGMETDHAIYDKEQLSLKVVGNSGYGFTGVKQGSLPCWPIAAAITGLGQERLQVTQNIAENTYMGVCTAYGDSVTEDTPVLVRYADGSIDYVTIDACSNGEWQNYRDSFHGGEKECSDAIEGLHVWSDAGFTPIERVIRHRTDKELFRVMTARGTVDVTEDHSLLDADANELTPRQAVIGQALLHVKPPMPLKAWADDDAEIPAAFALGYAFCTEGARRADGHVPMSVLNGSRHAMFAFREGYSYARFNVQQSTLCTTSKRAAAGLYHLMCVTGIEGLFPDTCAVTQHTTLMDEKHDNDDMLSNGILSVESLGRTDNHVYDLQTGNHHFGAGIGEMVVHNTDSIMPIIPVKTDEEANLIADDIVDMVNDCMVKPMELENEKMAELSLFLKKKRYIMKLIFRDGTYKHLFQGVEAKRRDSLPFTARIMQRVMDILTGKQDDQMTQFVVQQLKEKKPAWAVKLETLSDDERRALKYIPEYAEIRDKVPLCVKRSQWCAWLDALATGPDTKERERLLRAANYQMTGAQWRKQRLRKLLAGQTTRPIDTTGAAAVATYDARLLALKDKTSLRVFGQRTWRHWRARCLEKPSDGGIHRDAAISMIRSHLQDSVQRRVEYAVAYLMDELMLLCDGKIDPSELIQSKKISKLVYKNEPEHLIVRSKIAARTPGSEPQVGDRVPFMLCYPAVGDDSSNKKKRKRRAKFDNTELVEDPVYALQNNLTWAVAELIERKVMNPVMSIMRYFMDDPEEDIFQPIFGYLRKKVNKGRGIDASFHLFSNRYARCALCGGETPAPPKLPRKSDGTKSPTPPQVCVQCAGDESLRKRQRADAEHAIQRALVAKQRVEHTCNTCIRDNMAPLNNLHECENTGCPVWINRIKVFKEHHQTTNHESLMREACKVNALEW